MALVLLIAPSAHAQTSGWYADLGLGYSWAKFFPADFALNNPLLSEDKKNFDAGYKFAVGKQLSRTWAVEAGYVQLGKYQYFYNDAGLGGSVSLDYRVVGWALSVVPSIPFGDSFSMFGRIGAFFSNTRLTVASASGSLAGSSFEIWQSRETPLVGLGFQFDYDKDQSLRLEYENYGEVGKACPSTPCIATPNNNNTGRAIVQMVSANLIFKF